MYSIYTVTLSIYLFFSKIRKAAHCTVSVYSEKCTSRCTPILATKCAFLIVVVKGKVF